MLVEIIFVVLMVMFLICVWPGGPVGNYPWAPWIITFLLFCCVGYTLYGGGGGGARLGRLGGALMTWVG